MREDGVCWGFQVHCICVSSKSGTLKLQNTRHLWKESPVPALPEKPLVCTSSVTWQPKKQNQTWHIRYIYSDVHDTQTVRAKRKPAFFFFNDVLFLIFLDIDTQVKHKSLCTYLPPSPFPPQDHECKMLHGTLWPPCGRARCYTRENLKLDSRNSSNITGAAVLRVITVAIASHQKSFFCINDNNNRLNNSTPFEDRNSWWYGNTLFKRKEKKRHTEELILLDTQEIKFAVFICFVFFKKKQTTTFPTFITLTQRNRSPLKDVLKF